MEIKEVSTEFYTQFIGDDEKLQSRIHANFYVSNQNDFVKISFSYFNKDGNSCQGEFKKENLDDFIKMILKFKEYTDSNYK